MCPVMFDSVERCSREMGSEPPTAEAFAMTCATALAGHIAKGGYDDDAIVEAELACWRKRCDDVVQCLGEVHAQRDELEARRKIDEAHARGNEDVVYQVCLREPEAARERCDGVLRERLQRQRREAEALVAKGDASGSARCAEMKRVADALGDSDSAAAADESCALTTAADALADADEALQRRASAMPPTCRSAVLELDRQNAPWAAEQSAKVVDACYAKLAVDILRREVPRLGDDCPEDVRRAWAGVRRHGIRDEALRKVQAKVARLCPLEETGVPECDRFIIDYRECIDTKMPEAARETSRKALQTSIDAWKKAAATAAGREGLGTACQTAIDAIAPTCGW